MANRTINTNQLNVGTQFAVSGVVNFSRIASQIDGAELEKDAQRRRARGWNPIERPYTTITISHAQVRYKNPNQKRPEEIYAEESLYKSTKNPNDGFFYSAQNRGNNLPWVTIRNSHGQCVDQIVPDGELAQGLRVTLIMKVFKGKPNNGISLEGVILDEEPRYYNGMNVNLEEFGLTFNPLPSPAPQPVSAAANNTNFAQAPEMNDNEDYSYTQDTHADHFSSQPAQQFNNQNPSGMPFSNSGGGIVYNPQSGNRNY